MKRTILILLLSSSVSLIVKAKNFNSYTVVNRGEIFLNQHDDAITFMKRFFEWYKEKNDYLNHKLHFVNINIKKPAPYRINFIETEKYLSVLKASGFFSDNYIGYYRDFFKKIDANLQKTKQDDGEVDELDHDFIMYTQEPEFYLKNLNVLQLTMVKSTDKDCVISMKTKFDPKSAILFHLLKASNSFLIDKIDP